LLHEYHRKFFFPANSMLALRGDFSAARLRSSPGLLLGDWTASGDSPMSAPPPSEAADTAVYLAPSRLADRCVFGVLQRAGRVSDDGYPAAVVGSTALVQRMSEADLRRRTWDLLLNTSWNMPFGQTG